MSADVITESRGKDGSVELLRALLNLFVGAGGRIRTAKRYAEDLEPPLDHSGTPAPPRVEAWILFSRMMVIVNFTRNC